MPADRKKRGRRAADRPRASANDLQWLYGFHPVREALRARRRKIARLWLREGASRAEDRELIALAEAAGIVVEAVGRGALEERVGGEPTHQGVALEAGPLPELTLAELIEQTRRRAGTVGRRIVALDGVEDPQNVGALARVAESAGGAGLVLTHRRAPELTPAVAKASAGAIEWLPVARVANLPRSLRGLKQAGFWIIAAAAEESTPLFQMEDRLLTGDLVLVLGAEGRGVRPGVLDEADHRVWLPMLGEVASLNVSTAGAVLLYDLLRRSGSATP